MTTTPRSPSDRKPKGSDVMRASEQPPLGFDTLRPVAELRSVEIADAQADIMQLFQDIGIDLDGAKEGESVEIETSPDVIRAFGSLSGLLERYVIPDRLDDFIKVDSGKGSQARIADLAMYFLAELGESDGSAS